MSDPGKVRIEYASTADVARFFPDKLPYRLQAYIAKAGDEVLGLGGLYYLNDTRVAFLTLTDAGKKHPVTLCRWVKIWLHRLQKSGIRTVNAVADPSIPSAVRFLTHFGFKPIDIIQGHTVYQWTP